MDIDKLKTNLMRRNNAIPGLVVALLVAVGGSLALRAGQAATLAQAAEAESGKLTGNAVAATDSSASGSASVKFGTVAASVSGRPCSASSPWNTPATGTADPRSAEYMTSGTQGSLKYFFTKNGEGFGIAGTDDYPDYGVPIYYANATTPLVRVNDTYGWWGGTGMSAPIPAEAIPAIGTDHHLSIWNTSDNKLYEFWELTKPDGKTWTAGAAVVLDANGSCYQTVKGALSARAYGGALQAGAITLQDMKAGVIDHALGMAYPGTRGQKYAMGLGADGKTQNIATHSDNYAEADRNTDFNIPEGARFRLKQSVDINARCGSNAACKVIGTALKTYGSYVVDNAAVPTFYGEVLTNKSEKWGNRLHIGDAKSFQAEDFELLSLPSTLTSF